MALRTRYSGGFGVSVIALAVATGTVPTAALAQTAPGADAATDSGDAIVVTGIRAAINSSTSQKRLNTSIVEVISSEDLGKLPDMSIAESLSRLPGFTTQRLDGRANVASIRGLGPDFTTTLLNGREQVSINNNRGVELDQYPAELLNGATVYKTPDAMLIGQALGGTVDMKTIRPLTYGKTSTVITARGEINSLKQLNPDISRKGYRVNVFHVGQNADKTIGWAIGYARMQSPTQEQRWNAWGYPDLNATTKVIGGAKPYVKSNELKRDGLMGVLEFEPNDRFHTTFDGYWSKFNDKQRLRGIELPLQWSAAQLQPGYTTQNGLVTSGRFTGVEAVMRNDVVNRDAEIFAFGNNTKFKATDTLTLELDLSYSKVTRTEQNLEIYLGTGRGGGVGATDSLGFTMPASGGVITFAPTINYADPALFTITDPQGWNSCGGTVPNCQDGFINRPRVKDRLRAIRLQAIKSLGGFIDTVTVGANYSDRRKQLVDEGFVLTNKTYPASPAVPASYLFAPVSLGFIGIPGMVSFDSWRYYNDGNYNLTSEARWEPSRLTNSYVVREKVLTGYVQGNIVSGGLKGNVGLQVVHTNQSADGYRAYNPGNGTISNAITDKATYTNFLPSLNLSYELASDTVVRFAAARMLARARMDRLNPGVSASFSLADNVPGANINRSPWSGRVGNARLRPLMANTVDVAVERYFGKGGYVSAGAFYKQLEDWVYRQDTLFDFTGTPTPGNVTPTFNQGIVSQWLNGTKAGKLFGFEASGSLPLATFSEALDGFGVLASASYSESEVREGNSPPISIPGLSSWVINGTAYYEKNGFQLRASARYRSKFLAEVSGLSLARELQMAAGETIIDAQIGYTFQSGSLEGLGILLQGTNLTNAPFKTYLNNDERQIRDFQRYGRNLMLGVTYKF